MKPHSSAAETVIVVDDDPEIRKSLDGLLRSVGLKTQMFDSVGAFLAAKLPKGPRCLVLDVRMPGPSGLDLHDRLTNEKTGLPTIFMTGYGDIPMSVRAMKAGAVEFLTKPYRQQDLLDAIHVALEKDRSQMRARATAEALEQKYASLTPREKQVMTFAVLGRRNKQIAAEIGISEVTVKVHRGNIMQKLGARSLVDLVRIADLLQLHPPAD